jgi:hypothetical protein
MLLAYIRKVSGSSPSRVLTKLLVVFRSPSRQIPWSQNKLGDRVLSQRFLFLGALAKLRKATMSFVLSVRSSVLMEQLGSSWTDFHVIWYLSIFRKSVEKIKFH